MKSTSPPPDASGTARGLVNLLAQTFAGVKTFLSAVIMSAGLTLNGSVNQMVRVTPPATVSLSTRWIWSSKLPK